MALKVIRNNLKNCKTSAGHTLRSMRLRLNLPSTACARKVGITTDAWCHVETGTSIERAHELLAVLMEIESTPGMLEKMIKDHEQYNRERKLNKPKKDNGQTSLPVKAEAPPVTVETLDRRLTYLEAALGVNPDDSKGGD